MTSWRQRSPRDAVTSAIRLKFFSSVTGSLGALGRGRGTRGRKGRVGVPVHGDAERRVQRRHVALGNNTVRPSNGLCC